MAAKAIIDWLIQSGARCPTVSQLLAGYCEKLRADGIAVDRSTMGAPLLHPIAQSSYVFWNLESGASQRWFQWTPDALETMRASPIYPVYTAGKGTRIALADPAQRARFPICEELWAEGFAEYLALPLEFSDGTYKVLTVATRSEGGFSARDRATIGATLPACALVFEGFIASNTARTLMETYVGKRAGRRVLDGEISRGDGSEIEAVIWFSDLRDFTGLSERLGGAGTLTVLNDYFGLMTECIEANGGEVLKFIGDAVLAVFAYDRKPREAVARAERAAFDALGRRGSAGDFDFGIGMHMGKVFYGNIGGGTRLDFTVIGQAVNLASRIEGLAGRLHEPLLVSGALVEHSERRWRRIDDFALKGVSEPVPVHAPE